VDSICYLAELSYEEMKRYQDSLKDGLSIHSFPSSLKIDSSVLEYIEQTVNRKLKIDSAENEFKKSNDHHQKK
jgi:hypothetical protein